MSYEHRDPPFVMNSQQAAKFVYSNLDKSGVVYPKIGLFIVSLVLKAMPTKLIDRLNY